MQTKEKNGTVCANCGKLGIRVRRVTQAVGQGRSAFLIENVPVISCPSCGESYMTASTLHEIERIRQHWRELAVEKTVQVAKFKKAA